MEQVTKEQFIINNLIDENAKLKLELLKAIFDLEMLKQQDESKEGD